MTDPIEAQAVPDQPVATITKDEALSALADVYLALPFGSASRVTLVRRFIEQSRPTPAAADRTQPPSDNEGLFRQALRFITAVEDRFGLEKAREIAREALKADATKQQMFNGLTQEETDATASVMGLVHLALSTSSMPTAAPLLSSRETDRSELPRGPLVDRLRDEADLCANEGADDIARLLNEAADALIGESQ